MSDDDDALDGVDDFYEGDDQWYDIDDYVEGEEGDEGERDEPADAGA